MKQKASETRFERYETVANALIWKGYSLAWQRALPWFCRIETWEADTGPVILVQVHNYGIGLEVFQALTDSGQLSDVLAEIEKLRR